MKGDRVHILNDFQKKALQKYMNKYGVDAGFDAIIDFQKTGLFGRAMIMNTPRGKLVKEIIDDYQPVVLDGRDPEAAVKEVKRKYGLDVPWKVADAILIIMDNYDVDLKRKDARS